MSSDAPVAVQAKPGCPDRGDSGGSLLAVTCLSHSKLGVKATMNPLTVTLYVHMRADLAACEIHAYKRYTPIRCTPIRYTPVRDCTPKRYTPVRDARF